MGLQGLVQDFVSCVLQVKGFFMSLFIASTGLVMSPRFLAAHLPVLAAGVFLVVLGKGILVRSPLRASADKEILCARASCMTLSEVDQSLVISCATP